MLTHFSPDWDRVISDLCCESLQSAIRNSTVQIYNLTTFYIRAAYKTWDDSDQNHKIFFCPFCGQALSNNVIRGPDIPHAAPNNPGVNACCQIEVNLKEMERHETKDAGGADGGPLIVYQCRVCQRKHYVHEVKPFSVGMKISGLGD